MLKDLCKAGIECMTDMPRQFTRMEESSMREPQMKRGEYSMEYDEPRRREAPMRRREEEPSWMEGSYKSILVTVFTFMVSILLLSFVGKFLWNVSVAQLFTIARPVESVWQIIAFMVLLSLLR